MEEKTHNEVIPMDFSNVDGIKKLIDETCLKKDQQVEKMNKVTVEYLREYTDIYLIHVANSDYQNYYLVNQYASFSEKGRVGLPTQFFSFREFRLLNYVQASISEIKLFIRFQQDLDKYIHIDTAKVDKDGNFQFRWPSLWRIPNMHNFSLQAVGECKCWRGLILACKGGHFAFTRLSE